MRRANNSNELPQFQPERPRFKKTAPAEAGAVLMDNQPASG
jgi:hypothetical protein